MTLREYAKNNNLSYSKAYREYAGGKVKGYKDQNGQIVIGDPPESSVQASLLDLPTPMMVELGSTNRTNKSASIKPTDRYKNIDEGIIPFNYSVTGYSNESDVSIRDAIILCQKCYYNFALFRVTIDLMTEFCTGQVHFRKGSKKSKEFFKAYWDKLNLWQIQDMFYREYFRSGNYFVYRQEGEIQPSDLAKITQTYGAELFGEVTVPIKYVVLNPADINATGNVSFANVQYYKILSDYELERLRNPRTEEDKQVFDSLDPQSKELIKNKNHGIVKLPLDKSKIVAIFYKKQSYEAFAVPMGFPVLEDINFKKELRLMDQAIARTAQQAILLVTMGAEPEKGGINHKNIGLMTKLFENESVARVVIADYTTKAEFIIPQIADILDPKKYEMVDKDIAIGLNNVLLGQGEKFANQNAKIELFVEKLKHARQAFINEFLKPEIKYVSQAMGLKNYPEPYYEDIDLKNDIEYAKLYVRLAELGILTAEESIEAIETGKLPTSTDSIESQKEFKDLKDDGLYEPLLNKKKEEEAGRPGGSKSPKNKLTVSPIGASAHYSFLKIKENILLAQELQNHIETKLLKKHKLKNLNDQQKEIADQIATIIVANEEPENWKAKIEEYIDNPIDQNKERINKINELAGFHQVDFYMASILFASIKEDKNG